MHVVYSHMLYVTFCCLTGFWLCISLCHIYFVFKFSWIQELTNFVMWWLDWFMTLSSQLHQRHQCSLSVASIMLNTSNEIKKLMATKDWQSCCWSRGFFLLLAYSFVCVQCVCDTCVPFTGYILIRLKGGEDRDLLVWQVFLATACHTLAAVDERVTLEKAVESTDWQCSCCKQHQGLQGLAAVIPFWFPIFHPLPYSTV